jgi:hypothetical protein
MIWAEVFVGGLDVKNNFAFNEFRTYAWGD